MTLESVAAFVKLALYGGLSIGAGVALAGATLRQPARPLEPFARRLIAVCAGVAAAATVSAAAVLLARLGSFDASTLSMVFDGPMGVATALQCGGAIGLLLLARFPRARLAGGVAALASFGVVGHAAALGPIWGTVAVVHVVATAWWVGGLLLLRAACKRLAPRDLSTLVRRFSRQATAIVLTLLIAGSALIVVLQDFSRPEWFTPYARTLTVKVASAVSALAVAAYNRFRLSRRLADADSRAFQALRHTVTAELIAIAGVLAATAWLTTFNSPHE